MNRSDEPMISHQRIAFDRDSGGPGNSIADEQRWNAGWPGLEGESLNPGAAFAQSSPRGHPNIECATGQTLFSNRFAFLRQQPFVEFWIVVSFRP